MSIKSGLQTNSVYWKLKKLQKSIAETLVLGVLYKCSGSRTEKLTSPYSNLSSPDLWTSPGVVFLAQLYVFVCSAFLGCICTVFVAQMLKLTNTWQLYCRNRAHCRAQEQISWCTSIKPAPGKPWQGFCVLMELGQHCECLQRFVPEWNVGKVNRLVPFLIYHLSGLQVPML